MIKRHSRWWFVVVLTCCILFANKKDSNSNDTFVEIRPPDDDGSSDISIVIIHECSEDEDNSINGIDIGLCPSSIFAFDYVCKSNKEDDDAHKNKHHKKGNKK